MKERFAALTGIRAVAASMVFLYHNRKYWREWLPDLITRFLNEFHTGVTLFFVLSGFLIAYTYADKPLESRKTYFHYLLIRLARIFPVYLILLSITYWGLGFPKVYDLFINYSLIKGLSDVHNLDAINQSWSLTVELCFYMMAPLLFWQTKKNWIHTLLLLLLLGGIAIAIGYFWHAINGNPQRWFYNYHFVLDATFFGRSIEFFSGMLLAYLMKKESPLLTQLPRKNLTLYSFLLIMISIYGISLFEKDVFSHGTEFAPGLIIRNIILPFFICCFLYGLITENTWTKKFLSLKLIVLLGNASYFFYLIHIGFINRKLMSWISLPDRNFTLLWIVSIAGYLLLEKPLYDLSRKLLKAGGKGGVVSNK